ncbi:uncharacterized protein [Dermacentor andersoni]|uniref:uncharacterized protein n=1 Tax=Dermacentor andersoni TaxID=34620 RepID=UPI0021558814|nr:uncharacterized protein LOC126541275 [Dermacentor andersoni]XP_054932591.1 uncharacterized protein LOC126541275 [Dermacentor andersoni]
MALVIVGVLFMVGIITVSGQFCTPQDAVAHALEQAPDALKLMQQQSRPFFLVYHSRNSSFHHAYPCLRAARITPVLNNRTIYLYDYKSTTGIKFDLRGVGLDKTDEAYLHPNEFTIDIGHGHENILQDFQVIYTDYRHCVLFWSWSLGYQVWVESSYLKTRRKVPEVCYLVYELLEPRTRHVVYKWKMC